MKNGVNPQLEGSDGSVESTGRFLALAPSELVESIAADPEVFASFIITDFDAIIRKNLEVLNRRAFRESLKKSPELVGKIFDLLLETGNTDLSVSFSDLFLGPDDLEFLKKIDSAGAFIEMVQDALAVRLNQAADNMKAAERHDRQRQRLDGNEPLRQHYR